MKRTIIALSFLAAFVGCSSLSPARPSVYPAARQNEDQAIGIIWYGAYGHTENEGFPPPRVRWHRGAELTCPDKNTAKPGFWIPELDPDVPGKLNLVCVEGLTMSLFEVHVADHGEPFSDTALAHELMHVHQFRDLIIDPEHKRPEWQPGGDVDRANAMLRERGL